MFVLASENFSWAKNSKKTPAQVEYYTLMRCDRLTPCHLAAPADTNWPLSEIKGFSIGWT